MQRRFSSGNAAFTLIEIMIVISIIGILASFAITKNREFKRTAMQAEPKQMLNQIRVLQESYRAEHSEYVRNINSACSDPISECRNRLPLTRNNVSNYEDDDDTDDCTYPASNNPSNNNYYRARLGFKVTDCRKLRYWYASNGYYHVARELGTSFRNEDRRVFPGCTERYDTWVLTAESKEFRHSGTRNVDHNIQRTTVGYDANTQCAD